MTLTLPEPGKVSLWCSSSNGGVYGDDMPRYLYRLFGADGSLLYIGQTVDLGTRLRNHSRSKSWWPEVATWTADGPYPGKRAALTAEAEATCQESPRYSWCPLHRAAALICRSA